MTPRELLERAPESITDDVALLWGYDFAHVPACDRLGEVARKRATTDEQQPSRGLGTLLKRRSLLRCVFTIALFSEPATMAA